MGLDHTTESALAPTRAASEGHRRRQLQIFLGRDAGLGYLLVLPLLIVTVGLLVYPIGNAALISLQDKFLGIPGSWIGLENYRRLLFEDSHFHRVLGNTVVYTITAVAIKLVVGMIVALTLNQRILFRGLFRSWILLSWTIPVVIAALVFRWLFDSTGILNNLLRDLGLIELPIIWLGKRNLALFVVILATVWRGFPFFGVTLLSGLQAISHDLYEASEMDGASVIQQFLYVTLPGLRSVILVVTILSTIWTFNEFAMVFVLTGGGPMDATELVSLYTYNTGFKGSRLGYATAISILITPILMAMILILSRYMWEGEES